MSSQPSGIQERIGIYIQDEYTYQALTITAGLRYENYNSSATDNFNTKFNDLDTEVSHNELVYALSANYQLTSQLSIFANHQQGFRAPLIDELYDQFSGRNPSLTLQNELSTSNEIGATWQQQGLISKEDALTARFIYFDVSVDDEIESHTNSQKNPIPNPRYKNTNANDRDGIELEINYANHLLFANIVYSTISGEDQDSEPLWFLPADKLAFDTGLNFFDQQVEIGLRFSIHDDRTIKVYDRATRSYLTEQHDGYTLVDLFSHWQINDQLSIRVAIDNILDEEYQVIAGSNGSIGDYGLGRNIKTQLSYNF